VHSGKVALPGRMLVVGSIMAVVVHSACSFATVVAASEHWVSTSGAMAVASEIEGDAFVLASAAGSIVVA
jgi:hypothetical protein